MYPGKIGEMYQVLIPENTGRVGFERTDWQSAFHQHKKVVLEAVKYYARTQDRELISNKEVAQPDTQLLVVHNTSPVSEKKRGCSID